MANLTGKKCAHAGCIQQAALTIGPGLTMGTSEYCLFHQRFVGPVKVAEETENRGAVMAYKHRFAPTVFIDLDGVLVEHRGPMTWYDPLVILPGVHETFTKWWNDGVKIIITTGRPASNRDRLEEELSRLGIFYHQLVMDCGSGPRYLINDIKPYDPVKPMAQAINLPRNVGLASQDINIR